MTATNSEYWKNLHCDMKHLILHLGGLYCDRDILLEQFAMAIAYSNQSSIGVLSNAVLMMSCIYWVSDLDQHPLLVRPYNILLLQENVHSFQEKMVCTYVFRQIRTSFSGLETAYTKLKHSIEDSEKLTISLSTYRKALKRLQFYIALSRWYIINIYQNQNTSHILQIRNDTIIVVGEFKEIVEYMRSWEEAMKTWATELFINIYNIDYIVTQWHREYSHDMSKVIKFLLAEADSRLVSVVQPGASQVMQDGHESSVGRNINSDDESNITTKVAVDDDDSNSFAEDESNITTKVALDNDASNSFGEKRPRRQSSRLTRQAADAVKDGLGQQSNIQDEEDDSGQQNKIQDEDEAHDSCGKTKKRRQSSDSRNINSDDESNITTKVALDNDASNSFGEKRPRRQSSRLTRQAADAVKDGLGQQSNIQDEEDDSGQQNKIQDEDEAHDSCGKTKKRRQSSDSRNINSDDESNITSKVALDNDASNSFGEKRPRRQSSRLTSQAADAVKDGLGQQSNIQDEDEDEAHDSYGKTKKTRHSSRLQSNKPNEDLCGNIKKPGHSSSLKIKRKDDNETHCADIEAEKEKDAVEFDIMEDIKKIRSMGTCVVGFADLATQKLRCLTQELKKNFETLSRQNTLTNTTLTSHLGLIAGFDVRLEKYLKGKQWTTCNKDDSTAVLVDCQDSGKKHKIRLITLEEKVASKRKLGNVLVVNGPILDSKMVIELIDAINRSPMCKSTDVLGGSKKDTYLGYFSQRNPTQYGYRDGTIAIQAMPIKGAMTPLLDIVQNHVLKILYDHMGDQKKLIPTLLGTDIFKVKQNSLQINLSKGGGGFGEHTDSNSTTCMIGTEITNQTDEYFPYESEMVVITFFICLDKNQQLVNNNKCKSRLIFRSRKTKEVVGEIITESIGFHIQFANVQHACLHAIDKVGPQEEGFTRIALSSRYTLKQKYVGKKYNYYIRSLDHINGPLEDAILVDDPTVIPTNTMEVENLTTNTKDKDIEAAFASDSLKLDTVGMTQLIRNPVALGVPRNSSVNSLRSRLVFNTLMKAKKNLNVVQKKRGKETMIRYYTRLEPIGTIMEADKVRGMLELRKGGQSSVVGTYHNDLNHMHGIVLEHQYKNMMMNALPYFELVYKFRSNKTELYKKINKQKPEDMRYTVGPSGGNYANGNAFMTQTSKVDNTVCKTAHTGQISQSMIAACLNRIVIGDVWVPLEWATSNGHKKSRGKKMINVGPARGYSCSGHSHCDDQPTHLVKHGVNGSWTTVGNMVYELEQVYHKDNLVPSFYSGYEVKGWSDFVFEGERIGVGVNRSDRLPSTPTDFADRHPAIVANKWITNELKERDKVSSSIHKNNSGKKDLVTIEELIAQIARISLASFARMKQYSVNPNGVSYLPLLEVGMVNGTYPIPNVSRCYHIPTMMIITELGVKDQSTGRYVRRSISSIKQPDEMLFIMMAIMVVRTTGGTLLFQLFHQYYKGEDIICDEFDLPSTSCKWDAFMRFMLEKIKRGAHGMERFVTVLYDRSLCDAAYGTVQEYVSFLEAVKRDLRSYLMECRNIGKQNGFNYTDLVLLLSNLLESNGYNQRKIGATEKKHCKFVGHQIACDMNELFHDAIHYDKKKNKIHFGSYGQKGLDMIVGSTTVKNASDKLVTLTKKILTALTQKKNQYLLDTLGLYLKNGIVVSKINDAPVWEADVESWLCKLVITSQKTGGAFCGSSKLCLNNRKYEFPLSNAPEQFEPFYHIAEEALYGLFSNRRDFGLLPVSSHFRYVSTEVWDEDENWKASCKVGLARQKTLLRYVKILNR